MLDRRKFIGVAAAMILTKDGLPIPPDPHSLQNRINLEVPPGIIRRFTSRGNAFNGTPGAANRFTFNLSKRYVLFSASLTVRLQLQNTYVFNLADLTSMSWLIENQKINLVDVEQPSSGLPILSTPSVLAHSYFDGGGAGLIGVSTYSGSCYINKNLVSGYLDVGVSVPGALNSTWEESIEIIAVEY